jgi:hypothetical protein
VFWLQTYCLPAAAPWAWPWHELPAAPSVPRDLRTYVYDDGYADQVAAHGFRVRHVGGQLYAVDCDRPSAEVTDDARPAVARR